MSATLSSRRTRRRVTSIVVFCCLVLGAMTMVMPFIWMVSTSLKTDRLVFDFPPQWFPNPVDWANYVEVWSVIPLARGMLNSAMITVIVVVLGTFSTSMAAFAFAKMRFPMKNLLFTLLLATMMIPGAVVIIPQFIAYSNVGWIDTLLPLIVPGTLGNVVMLFFIRQYMMGLSNELMDAAKIDGAGFFRIYWQIFLPLCKPAIAANTIIVFMGTWNDYFGPLIYTSSPENSSVQLAISQLMSFYAETMDFPIVMTASVLAVVPVVVMFTAMQRYFVDSFVITGIKG